MLFFACLRTSGRTSQAQKWPKSGSTSVSSSSTESAFEKVFTHLAFRGDLVQRGLHTLSGEAVAVGCAEDAVAGGIGVDDELRLAGGRPVAGDLADVRPVWLLR